MKIPLILFCLVTALHAVEQRYPAHRQVIDVTQPPYSAKGDGVTDCTEALQQALNENVGGIACFMFRKELIWCLPR